MRSIGIVTVARSDYGIYFPLLRKIEADPDLRLHLFVGGTHLSQEFGSTVDHIEADGFGIEERVEMLLSADTPSAIAKSIGLGTIGFAQAFARFRPDILVVLGDRFEMYSAAVAALPFRIPVAHIHGGELTLGATDDALRHSMTKLSHLHFVATEDYARRVMQMGEEPWRVVVSGALSLDNISTMRVLSLDEFRSRCHISLAAPFLLVTFHPVTLEPEQTAWQMNELLEALDSSGLPTLFSMPNADVGGRAISRIIAKYVAEHHSSQMVQNLGNQGYISAMALSVAMVGNTSSGIVEAGFLKVPVVNVGTRQQGRMRSPNIIDVGYGRHEILAGIRRATSREFRANLQHVTTPYGDGRAADRIVRKLKETALDDLLLTKRFVDYQVAVGEPELSIG